jgi:arabinan endo-1,5-alpha-L-arabinosidase
MLEVDGTFYRFWTGDFIPMATSTDLANWQNAPPVYGNSYPAWVGEWLAGVSGETFNFPWAPDVSTFGGEVHLYSTFSAKFGENISCITHLSTPDIADEPFEDHGPVVCTEGSENYNAIDADVGFDEAGTPWLAFGSFWDGIMGMELGLDGSPVSGDLTELAWASEIEAPVLFRRCGYYYLFVSHGLCCPGEGRSVDDLTYRVLVGRSDAILGPYLDKNGNAMTDGGGTLVVEGDGATWAAAGHSDVLVDGESVYHLYHAYRKSNGNAELRIAELWWGDDGWPVPHAP